MKFFPIIASCLLLSGPLHSASLGTYRVYLDTDKRSQKFPVRNKTNFDETCSVSFQYLAYDGMGNKVTKKLTEEEEKNILDEFQSKIRYSPKNFTLKAQSTQYIAFSLRRRIGDSDGEYRAYPAIHCQKATNSEVTSGFTTALELRVPFVIRTGKVDKLNAELEMEKVTSDDGNITVRFQHSGNRSVYGHVSLVDKDGEVVSTVERNTVIYPEMNYRDFQFRIPEGHSTNDLFVNFKEIDELKNSVDVTFSL